MQISSFIDNINKWRFSDYTLDDSRQGYGFTRQAWRGRLVSIVDIGSQASKTVVGTIASIGIAAILLAPGTFYALKAIGCGTMLVGCYLVRSSCNKSEWRKSTISFLARSLIFFGGSAATFAIAIPTSLLWRVFMVSANVLGIMLPEIGRKGRIIGKILSPTLEMIKCLPQNPREINTQVASARPVYHHDSIPLALGITLTIVSKPFDRLVWKISGESASPVGTSFQQAWKAASTINERYKTPFAASDKKTPIDILLLNHLQ